MRLTYINTEGNRIVVGFPTGVDAATAISQIDPQGDLNITVLNDEDPIPLTPEQSFQALVKQFDDAVEDYLHAEAVSAGYTNIERACMYASGPNPYAEESHWFVAWVGEVWAYCYTELQKVKTGERHIPTIEQIISELPTRVIPQ